MNQVASTENKNLELYELPSGEMAIKNLTVAHIRNMERLYELTSSAVSNIE